MLVRVFDRQPLGSGGGVEVAVGGKEGYRVESALPALPEDFEGGGELDGIVGTQVMLIGQQAASARCPDVTSRMVYRPARCLRNCDRKEEACTGVMDLPPRRRAMAEVTSTTAMRATNIRWPARRCIRLRTQAVPDSWT